MPVSFRSIGREQISRAQIGLESVKQRARLIERPRRGIAAEKQRSHRIDHDARRAHAGDVVAQIADHAFHIHGSIGALADAGAEVRRGVENEKFPRLDERGQIPTQRNGLLDHIGGFFIDGDVKSFLFLHQPADQELQAENRLARARLAAHEISLALAQPPLDQRVKVGDARRDSFAAHKKTLRRDIPIDIIASRLPDVFFTMKT